MPEYQKSSKLYLSLGLRILLYSLLFILLAWWGGRMAYDRAMLQLHAQGSDRLLNSIGQLRRTLGQYSYLPFLIAQNLQVRAFLRQPDEHNRTLVNRVLEQFNLVAGSTALFVLDPTGEPLAYSNWRDERSQRLPSQWSRHYFRQALTGEQGQELQYQEDQKTATFFMSAPIYDGGLAGGGGDTAGCASAGGTTDHGLSTFGGIARWRPGVSVGAAVAAGLSRKSGAE